MNQSKTAKTAETIHVSNYQHYQQYLNKQKRNERRWWIAAISLLIVFVVCTNLVGCGGSTEEDDKPMPEMDACNTNVPGLGPCIVRTAPKQ